MVKVDILSDPICPWCYIGKAHLDRALEQRPDHAFEIEWHPYQLNPAMPPEGMDRRAYLEAKFGGAEGAEEVYGRIAEAAAQAGIDGDFDAIARTPNTLDAHRVIHWSGLEGRQSFVVSKLFEAYFRLGEDIGSAEVLIDCAGRAGLDRDMIGRLLAGDADRREITERDAHARARGVTGVPTFVVAQRHVVSGAQPPDLWLRVLDELEADAADARPDG